MFIQFLFGQQQGFVFLLFEYILAAILVLVLSVKLTVFADRLERATRLSEIWIGMLLLAFVTSLPEAVTSIGATFIDGAKNLGIGNLLGSNMFNIVIIVALDFVQGPGPILFFVKDNHVFTAAGGILLMALAGWAIALHVPFSGLDVGGYSGVFFSVAIAVAFLAVTWMLARRDARDAGSGEKGAQAKQPDSAAAKQAISCFAVCAVAVVLASIWLLGTCDALARQPITLNGRSLVLGHTFVGAFLVAASTSLPELFVSLGALKLGRINMSVANIFGSNIINMAFIPLMHLFDFRPGFYSDISPANLVMIFAAIIMSTFFMAGLLMRSKKSFLFLGWEAVLILGVYFSAVYMVFRMGSL